MAELRYGIERARTIVMGTFVAGTAVYEALPRTDVLMDEEIREYVHENSFDASCLGVYE